MNYGFLPRAMWLVFRRSYRDAISSVLPGEDADAVIRQAHLRYQEILAGIPEFDKESRFAFNIYSCAMLSAVLLNLRGKYDVETIRVYYRTAMDNAVMRTFAKKSSAYTEKGRAALKKAAAHSENSTNPYDWKFTVEDGPTLNQYTATFLTCGICTLMNELGLGEYIPAMCTYDYDMAAMNNTRFSREFTLASGGPYCDCHYDHQG